MIDGIKTYGSTDLLNKIKNQEPVFMCTIGTTETSRIPGITGAGASPELTEFTPAGDAELLVLGTVRCMDGIPQTVVGDVAAPTPAFLTKASLELGNIPFVIVDAGSKIRPEVECMRFSNDYGMDIRTGKAVKNPLEIYENGRELGSEMSRRHDYLVIGESIAAGTTTALGILKALGYSANEKVSGSMPINPHNLKIDAVNEGLKNAGINPEDEDIDPFVAIAAVGDPVIPAIAGLILGGDIPVILGGGTQMVAVCAVIKAINPNFDFSRINIATTVYVGGDKTSDIFSIASQVDENLTVHIVDPGFENSESLGLRRYTDGFVKEGAGAGGAMFAALIRGVSKENLRKKIEKFC
jgi:uncharacterized protein (TIGR00303 family)